MARDLIGGIAAVTIGALYFAMALQIRASALDDTVGPAGLPNALAVIMIGLGVILCLKALFVAPARRASAAAPAAAPAETTGAPAETTTADDEAGRSGWSGIARAAGMLAIGVAYLLIVRAVGYIPAVAALIVAAALYGGAALTWRVFAIGAAGAILYWLVFVAILGIPLPGGAFAELFR